MSDSATAGRELERPESDAPAPDRLVRRAFLAALGVVHLIAFLSLWTQVHCLVGEQGILPVASYLEMAHERLQADAYLRLPTLCWLNASDRMLSLWCAAGTSLSLCLICRLCSAAGAQRTMGDLLVALRGRADVPQFPVGHAAVGGDVLFDPLRAARIAAGLARAAAADRTLVAVGVGVQTDAPLRRDEAALRRPLVARRHGPRLPLLHAAHPELAELVRASPAAGFPSGITGVPVRRRAGAALPGGRRPLGSGRVWTVDNRADGPD